MWCGAKPIRWPLSMPVKPAFPALVPAALLPPWCSGIFAKKFAMKWCRAVPRFFEDAVKENKWSVVGTSQFDSLQYEDDKPLTCKATFEIYPEIETQPYKQLAVEEETPQVTEAGLDKAIDEIREQAATFEVVSDRPAADGDY